MDLIEVLHNVKYVLLCGKAEGTKITKVCCDSRTCIQDCVFVCVQGAVCDGKTYAREAVCAGAATVVLDENTSKDFITDCQNERADVVIVQVPSARKALAEMSACFYHHPANRLSTIGITGTKGKTTTAYLIREVLQQAGLKVGLIGTIETIIGEKHIPANNTTPESCLLQEYLSLMAQAGMDAVVMEVSSQGLKQHRTDGFVFDYGIFTNLGEDHIGPNEHGSMEEYISCKGKLFQNCRIGIANCDDKEWKAVTKNHSCLLETYGFSNDAQLKAKNAQLLREEGKLSVGFCIEGENCTFKTASPGLFSVYNALAAIAVCRHFGVSTEQLQRAIQTVQVKGRMENIELPKNYTLLIDYAHNAMSLESLLTTLREYEPSRLLCLFGCGGNRSKLRRLEMGEVSGRLADFSILTSDNPRFEEPEAIIKDIEEGIASTGGQFVSICDRREAIAYAMKQAKDGDILVLAGKGHEIYQEICKERFPMDERVIIRQILGKEGT